MPTIVRKYGFMLLPAALGGAVVLGIVGLYLKAVMDSSFGSASETYAPQVARPAPQKAFDWNLGR